MGRIFYNHWLAKLLLLGGFHTIMLFGFVFSKKEEGELSERVINHELIHVAQFRECFALGVALAVLFGWLTGYALLIPLFLFYVLYVLEWLVSFVHHLFRVKRKNAIKANRKAYSASAMEMEAKQNEGNVTYLEFRKRFAFVSYYGKL